MGAIAQGGRARVVELARCCDAVLGVRERRLQMSEVHVRLEIRVILDEREHLSEHSRLRVSRRLACAGIHRPRRAVLGQRHLQSTFVRDGTVDASHEPGHEVMAALQHHVDEAVGAISPVAHPDHAVEEQHDRCNHHEDADDRHTQQRCRHTSVLLAATDQHRSTDRTDRERAYDHEGPTDRVTTSDAGLTARRDDERTVTIGVDHWTRCVIAELRRPHHVERFAHFDHRFTFAGTSGRAVSKELTPSEHPIDDASHPHRCRGRIYEHRTRVVDDPEDPTAVGPTLDDPPFVARRGRGGRVTIGVCRRVFRSRADLLFHRGDPLHTRQRGEVTRRGSVGHGLASHLVPPHEDAGALGGRRVGDQLAPTEQEEPPPHEGDRSREAHAADDLGRRLVRCDRHRRSPQWITEPRLTRAPCSRTS